MAESQFTQSPYDRTIVDSFFCVTTVTAGDALTADLTVSTADTYAGAKTTPATADFGPIIGVATETVVGSSTPPVTKVRAVVRGVVMKVKVAAAVSAANLPLVTDSTAGQLTVNVAANVSKVCGYSLTASGTLLDGTVVAGYCSAYLI